LTFEEAQEQLLRVRDSTVVTTRIALALWNVRRRNPEVSRNGQVLISYNEILEWSGHEKNKRPAYQGSDVMYTEGFRTDDRDDVARDIELASRIHLQGNRVVYGRTGKPEIIKTKGPYIHMSTIDRQTLWGTTERLGVWFGPGAWINDYDTVDNIYLAEIDRRLLTLNPHDDRAELRLALYLGERWRQQAHHPRYSEPISMEELLRHSVIAIDRNVLTNRFAPRIERALENLCVKGIVGSYACLDPVDKSKTQWGRDWLASRWRILPPDDLAQSYVDKGITQASTRPLSGRQQRKGGGTGNG
jgi:hypothetical protein